MDPAKTVFDRKNRLVCFFTYNGQFDEISGAFAVQNDGVVYRGLEFKVNVSDVTHVESWQVNAGIGDAEGHNIVEQI